jgi:abortive infection bacteriophage resistance protein
MKHLTGEAQRSRERFVRHFEDKYGDVHALPPYWMATELMTFGSLFTLLRGSPASVKQEIAGHFEATDTVFLSWVKAIYAVRNTCAHHGRLWNRELGIKPKIPKRDVRWHDPVRIENGKVFGVLSVLNYLLGFVNGDGAWADRLRTLLDDYQRIPLVQMGFPADWRNSPIWNSGGVADLSGTSLTGFSQTNK